MKKSKTYWAAIDKKGEVRWVSSKASKKVMQIVFKDWDIQKVKITKVIK